jgi:hypothetical protein
MSAGTSLSDQPGKAWLMAVNTIANSIPRRIKLGKLGAGFS